MTDQQTGTVATKEPEPERPTDQHVTTDDAANPLNPEAVQQAAQADAAAATDGGSKGKTDDSATSDNNQQTKPPGRRSQERRFARMRDRLTRTEQKLAKRDQEVEELRGRLDKLEAGAGDNPPAEPQLADFKTPQEYATAYAKWQADQKGASTPQPKQPKQPAQPATPAPPAPADEDVQAFVKRGKERLGDAFMEALEDPESTTVSPVMGEYMLESEHGPELYLYLADHQELARKIANKTETFAMRELEKLEALAKDGKLLDSDDGGDTSTSDGVETVETSPTGGDQGKRSKQTKAPAPPADAGRDGGDTALPPNPETESMEDYAARRRKEEARARGLPV